MRGRVNCVERRGSARPHIFLHVDAPPCDGMPRSRSRARQGLAAWGFRPPCARAEQQAYDDVLLAQDLQISILETVGVLGIGLGAINTSWAAAVLGRY